jgi:hypothetical protein
VTTDQDNERNPPLAELLDRLGTELPHLAQRLVVADAMRRERIVLMADGVRFRGLDELLSTLDRIEMAWAADPQLDRLCFLVARAMADFETAIEATLSGYVSVAADAMRDVMEVELLLLDFFVEPSRLNAWLTSTRSLRMREFRPVAVRGRLISLGLHEIVGTSRVAADYAAHSEALHVAPHESPMPFQRKGHVPSEDIVSLDSGFIEMFEHAGVWVTHYS